ncbi:MAG: hypothetical protein ACKOC9_17235, partial [Alphaproteobacteria bacterium]
MSEAIHAATLTLDTHVDIRWPDPPDATQETDRCVDFPKMQRGSRRLSSSPIRRKARAMLPAIRPPLIGPKRCCAISAHVPMVRRGNSAPLPINWKQRIRRVPWQC